MKQPIVNRIYACWIYVNDLQESIAFYEKIGFAVNFIDGDWVEFKLNDTAFALLKRSESKGKVKPQKTRIMFEVEDIIGVYKQLVSCGVKIIGDVRIESYGNLLTFEDPNGHWLEFFEHTNTD